LHPHGIHVPLYVFPPASRETGREIGAAVSWAGLARALDSVVRGSVRSTDEFVDATVEGSRTEGHVVVAVDGPTWNVAELRERYADEAVDSVCVRRVGLVDEEAMTVYESGWDGSAIRERVYELRDGSRALRDESEDVTLEERYAEWLREGGEKGVAAETSARLRQLGSL
jgi:hypothetical protein